MSDEEKPEQPTGFSIGYVNEAKTMLAIYVPIEKYANDKDGTAMLRGKLDEAKGLMLLDIQERRQRKAKMGVIFPSGSPNQAS